MRFGAEFDLGMSTWRPAFPENVGGVEAGDRGGDRHPPRPPAHHLPRPRSQGRQSAGDPRSALLSPAATSCPSSAQMAGRLGREDGARGEPGAGGRARRQRRSPASPQLPGFLEWGKRREAGRGRGAWRARARRTSRRRPGRPWASSRRTSRAPGAKSASAMEMDTSTSTSASR